METMRTKNHQANDYIINFRKILQEAEKKDKQAMDRFRSWFDGLMDPSEDAAYTDAVQKCTRNLKQNLRSAV